MSMTSLSNQLFIVRSQWTAAEIHTVVTGDPEPTLVLQGTDVTNGRGRPVSGSHADLVLDAVLVDLVDDGDRLRDRIEAGVVEDAPISGAGGAGDRIGLDENRSDGATSDSVARTVPIPHGDPGQIGRRFLWMPVSDKAIYDLATEEVGASGRPVVCGDSIARHAKAREPGGKLARLAAALVVSGFWAYRDRFRRAARDQVKQSRLK
jgi:hypothetical protein